MEQGLLGRLHSFTSATHEGFPAGASQPSSQMHWYLGCRVDKKLNEGMNFYMNEMKKMKSHVSFTCPGVTRSASMHIPCAHKSCPAFLQSSKRTVQRVPDHSGGQLQLHTKRSTKHELTVLVRSFMLMMHNCIFLL